MGLMHKHEGISWNEVGIESLQTSDFFFPQD